MELKISLNKIQVLDRQMAGSYQVYINNLCFYNQATVYLLKKMGINHSKAESFRYAFSGLKEAFKKEPNLRTHVGMTILVLIAALFLKFSLMEWILLTVTIFFVLILELLNTAMESLVNLVSPEIKKEAKVAKDVSAAAVLFASAMAVIVGVALFGTKLLALF